MTEATAEVVKNVKRPSIHAHGVVHVVNKILKQLNLILKSVGKMSITITVNYCSKLLITL